MRAGIESAIGSEGPECPGSCHVSCRRAVVPPMAADRLIPASSRRRYRRSLFDDYAAVDVTVVVICARSGPTNRATGTAADGRRIDRLIPALPADALLLPSMPLFILRPNISTAVSYGHHRAVIL